MSQTFWSIYDIAVRSVSEIKQYAQVAMSLQWAQAILLFLILWELMAIHRKLTREK